MNLKNKMNQENQQKDKFEKYKIYNYLVDFKKKFYKKDSDIWWPVNLSYGGKSYYPTNKLDSLSNPNTNIVHCCFNNHNLNTYDKKNYFKKHIDVMAKLNFFQFMNMAVGAI